MISTIGKITGKRLCPKYDTNILDSITLRELYAPLQH